MITSNVRHRHKFIMLAVILVLVLGFLLFANAKLKYRHFDKNKQGLSGQVTKKTFSDEVLPPDFPTTFPINKDLHVKENYQVTDKDGSTQSVRSYYERETSVDKIMSDFMLYLYYNKWTVTRILKNKNTNSIEAKWLDKTLHLNITNDENVKKLLIVTIKITTN